MSIVCQRVNARQIGHRVYLEQQAMRVILPVRGEERLFQERVERLGECLLQQSEQRPRVAHGLIEALAVDARLIEHAQQRVHVVVQ